jgi:hypothetical protein
VKNSEAYECEENKLNKVSLFQESKVQIVKSQKVLHDDYLIPLKWNLQMPTLYFRSNQSRKKMRISN